MKRRNIRLSELIVCSLQESIRLPDEEVEPIMRNDSPSGNAQADDHHGGT